ADARRDAAPVPFPGRSRVDGGRPVSEFDGLVAVVTGGASGIGLATARLLAERGARVAVLDLKTDDVPEPLAGFRCDVTADAEVRAAIDAVAERFGRID